MNHEGREGVVLGPGYFESIYKKAMHVELTVQESQGTVTVKSRCRQMVSRSS